MQINATPSNCLDFVEAIWVTIRGSVQTKFAWRLESVGVLGGVLRLRILSVVVLWNWGWRSSWNWCSLRLVVIIAVVVIVLLLGSLSSARSRNGTSTAVSRERWIVPSLIVWTIITVISLFTGLELLRMAAFRFLILWSLILILWNGLWRCWRSYRQMVSAGDKSVYRIV